MNATSDTESTREPAPRSFRVRLPGFLADEPTGLGDAVSRVTRAVGLRPCDGCRRRAAVLNRWMVFVPRRK